MAFQKRHYYGKGLSLIEKLEEKIGYDEKTGLIRDGSSEALLDTFENSSFAIANILARREKVGERILKGIEKHIGFNDIGLVYNKIGLSKQENKKVLPGEKTIYLANQTLMSLLYYLVGEKEKSERLKEKIDKEIGIFEFEYKNKKHTIYRHEPNKEHFYPFNNLLVGILNHSYNEKEKAEKLVKNVRDPCFDKGIGLLRGKPESKLYFTLDNALLATYLTISGKEKEAGNIVRKIEEKVGFDKEIGLIYRGALGPISLIVPKDSNNTGKISLKNSHPITDVLTYTNSQLAITYLCLAGMFSTRE